ncbi:unnamed protein product [Ceutorhynchus assimilis]|uniref:Uncharacterized protein n=1 Tax=Ceutorhynchus assimilis TaxID=467358 RepID=A0A9N9MVW6_9CUCU|nr:unnamed protein product [Ceutorhynchus assimilis]
MNLLVEIFFLRHAKSDSQNQGYTSYYVTAQTAQVTFIPGNGNRNGNGPSGKVGVLKMKMWFLIQMKLRIQHTTTFRETQWRTALFARLLKRDSIEDMPWTQNLWEKVEQHSKKGFLNWCKIVAGNKGEDVVMWNNDEYLRSVDEFFCDMVAEMSQTHSRQPSTKCKSFFTRLERACIELHQPLPEIKEEGLSLYEAQQELLKYVNKYEAVVNAKKLALENLNKKQIQLCKELDRKIQIDLKYPPLPTQAQFDKLEAEKFEREEKFVNLKHEITEIVDEIKYKPNSDFEREVLSSDDMMLSNQNLKMLEFFAK